MYLEIDRKKNNNYIVFHIFNPIETVLTSLFLFLNSDLKHSQFYNITVRAQNRLGQSQKSPLIQVQTKDVPIEQEG